MMRPARWRAALLAVMLFGCAGTATGEVQQVNPQASALKDFSDRVQQYVDLQKRVEGQIPQLTRTDDPAQISTRQSALAGAIRAARSHARQGDIFIAPVAPQFRRIIRSDLQQRGRDDFLAALQEVPTKYIPRVNDTYPTEQPLATVPPILLAKLQRLPEEVEYRFLGRHLILRDVKANLIVDFILNVVPSTKH